MFPRERSWMPAELTPVFAGLARQIGWWFEFHRVPLVFLVVLWYIGQRARRMDWMEAAGAGFCAGSVAGMIALVAKILFGRPRPVLHVEDGFRWFKFGSAMASFPSGHAAHCWGMAIGAAIVFPRLLPWGVLACLSVVWSRYATNSHYPSDLLVGSSLGIASGIVFGMAARTWLRAAPANHR